LLLSIKELIVVLLISIGVFKLTQPVAQLYCSNSDFARRCKVWLALTITVFLAPNFWVFVLVATPVLIRLGRRDSNPAAAFVFLLYLLPPISVPIPMIGFSYLISLDFHLLLTLCLLVPVAWRLWRDKQKSRAPGLAVLDTLLLAYCLLSSFLFLQPEIARGVLMEWTFTDCIRRVVSYLLTIYIPYFVISRTSTNRAVIKDMMASFSIKCALLAGVAIFESLRGWLLYSELLPRWGSAAVGYLARGGQVRAMASTGHSLVLGYMLAVAFGFWLYLQEGVQSKALRVAITGLLLFGLWASFSRGPWMVAILIYLSFAAVGPQAFSKVFRAVASMSVLALAVAISPLGQKIISVIPYFGGTVDVGNVEYRERLFTRSWQIIMDHPWFGDQEALLKMEDLRQGEGIIDIINGFINILLNVGFVGLSLFVLFILIGLSKALKICLETAKRDPELSKLGASIIACVLGSLLMMWVAGLIDVMTCILVGLMAAYVDLGRRLPASQRAQ
jgi:O-antigen ligase